MKPKVKDITSKVKDITPKVKDIPSKVKDIQARLSSVALINSVLCWKVKEVKDIFANSL